MNYISLNSDNRIMTVYMTNFSINDPKYILVDCPFLEKDCFDYKYINGEYVYDPIPKEENPKQETELEQLKKRVAELEKQATVAGG